MFENMLVVPCNKDAITDILANNDGSVSQNNVTIARNSQNIVLIFSTNEIP